MGAPAVGFAGNKAGTAANILLDRPLNVILIGN